MEFAGLGVCVWWFWDFAFICLIAGDLITLVFLGIWWLLILGFAVSGVIGVGL